MTPPQIHDSTLTRTDINGQTVASYILNPQNPTPDRLPVLLLHGWGGSIESMSPVASDLTARGWVTHTLDLPGFGRSPLPIIHPDGTAWGVADYTACVTGYLQAQNIPRAHWIGHSFGGRVSIMAGAAYPAYCDKIVLADSAGVLNPPSVKSVGVNIGKALFKLPGLNRLESSARQWARGNLGSADYQDSGALEPIFKRVITEDLLPFAARIQSPTLLIWGDQDVDTPLWQGQALEKAIPDAGLVVFPGADHFAYLQQLPRFVNIVDTFFSG